MRRMLAAFIATVSMAVPAMANESDPNTAKPGPLSTYSAADTERPGDQATGSLLTATPDVSPIRLPQRPSALPPLYASLAALNAFDVYSTKRALDNGAREVNPVMAATGGRSGAALALKIATTTSSIYLAERLWKKNRVAAVLTMLAANSVTAAIVARNFRNAR